MKSTFLLEFGRKVKLLRKKQKLTQEELAVLTGLHRTHISMIERAEGNLTLKNIQKIAQALEVSPDVLFSRE